MSIRFVDRRPTDLEEQAHAGVRLHFADQLKQFFSNCDAVDRLERNLSIKALAATMAASKPTDKFIEVDDGSKWHKSVDLMDNIYFCHRPITGGAEYAVVEHFQKHHTNEILNRGWNAAEVLRSFAYDQRQALQIWKRDMTVQVREFLAEKFPGHDMGRVADCFILRFNRPASQKQTQVHEQNQSRGVGI